MKCKIVLVITGATGTVTRGLEKSLEAIPGKYSTDSLHQTASCTRNITHNTESTEV